MKATLLSLWFTLLAVQAPSGSGQGLDCISIPCLNGGVCAGSGLCDCTGTGYEGIFCETPVADCIPEAVAGLPWKPPSGPTATSEVKQRCSAVYGGLGGGSITRTCNNGMWSPANYSQCLTNNADSAFLLLWVPLNVNSSTQVTSFLPSLETELLQLLGLNSSYMLSYLRAVEVPGPSPHFSVTFVLPLLTTVPSAEIQATLSKNVNGFSNGVQILGGLSVAVGAPWGVQGFYQADSCPCRQPTDSLFLGLCEEIVPVPACTPQGNGTFKCAYPYFLGDGDECTVDEDGDGFPNVPLEICTELNDTSVSFCIIDNCPSHYNPSQDITKCVAPPGFNGCLMEEDEVWEISWGNTLRGKTDKQRCPQGPGFTTRVCGPNGWKPAVTTDCGSYQFSQLEDDINIALNDDNLANVLVNSAGILQELSLLTVPNRRRRVPHLPNDLDTVVRLVNTALELLEEIQEGEIQVDIPDFSILDILSNVLASANVNGWLALQQALAGSRQLLDISERYGLYLSRTLPDDDNDRRLSQRQNILLRYNNAVPDRDGDQVFPESEGDVNGTFTTIPAQITIPRAFLREQMKTNRTSVPISTILYRNLELILPPSDNTTEVASMVLSSSVAQRSIINSPILQEDPIVIKFVFPTVENGTKYYCAFWEFSQIVGTGGWRTDGVSMMSQQFSSDGSTVTVTCNATHLTSFAVLVDLSGTLNPGDNSTGVDPDELLALRIVTYIGCIISLICLLATIIFFLVLGSELLQKVHYFIHLNLAIALFLAYLMFVVGIETAKANLGACIFVAAWLHYFFLSSFSWMLCEGIMLYLMLVLVFSKLSKRWFFFLIIGYGLPVVPMVITLAVRWSGYGVYGSDGTLSYCWLSTNNGVIWSFVGPMLAIIMVNLVFLVIALVTVFKTTHKTMKRMKTVKGMTEHTHSECLDMKEKRALFMKLFIATLVLLPLLGVTWILGLFTVNANTTLFAWLFTIFNSLQGVFIFFFHVLRSDKVWKSSRVKSIRASLKKQLTSGSLRTAGVERYNLRKMDTASSILAPEISTSGAYDVSPGQEKKQIKIESVILEAEESVEQVENGLAEKVTAGNGLVS